MDVETEHKTSSDSDDDDNVASFSNTLWSLYQEPSSTSPPIPKKKVIQAPKKIDLITMNLDLSAEECGNIVLSFWEHFESSMMSLMQVNGWMYDLLAENYLWIPSLLQRFPTLWYWIRTTVKVGSTTIHNQSGERALKWPKYFIGTTSHGYHKSFLRNIV